MEDYLLLIIGFFMHLEEVFGNYHFLPNFPFPHLPLPWERSNAFDCWIEQRMRMMVPEPHGLGNT